MLCFGGGRRGSASSYNVKKTKEVKRSEEIDKAIKAERKKGAKEVKLLLLGPGESGKSTVVKQMRLIHAGGFSKAEKKSWKNVIFHNLVDAFLLCFEILLAHGDHVQDAKSEDYIHLLNEDRELAPNESIPDEYATCFLDLWQDEGIQLAILKGNQYALHDNLHYFLEPENIQRIFGNDYLPTNEDILRTRLRTTGTSETEFAVQGLTYKMVDVGGQRSERKKWIHVFDNCQVVLFLAAISGYDQALPEDRNGNQMLEALGIFDQVVNSRYFINAAVILFLNKMDLFKEKLQSGLSPISRYFPDFHGGRTDVQAGQQYFAKKFRRLIRNPEKEMYTHYTNATDTTLLKITMDSVQDIIVSRNLHNLIL